MTKDSSIRTNIIGQSSALPVGTCCGCQPGSEGGSEAAPLNSVEAELRIPDSSSPQPESDIHTLAESRASLRLFGQCPVWNVEKMFLLSPSCGEPDS